MVNKLNIIELKKGVKNLRFLTTLMPWQYMTATCLIQLLLAFISNIISYKKVKFNLFAVYKVDKYLIIIIIKLKGKFFLKEGYL
jgi:hypothetical protein